MRHSLLPLAAVMLSVLLSSCGFMTPAQQYAGDRQDVSEIAVIQSHHGSPLGDEYHATISGYATKPEAGPSVVKRFGLPGFTDYPQEIQLIPGIYAFELYCFKSLTKPTFRPTLEIAVIQSYHGNPLGDEYHATISGYATKPEAGASVVKRFGLPGFTDYPREIQLIPGNYAFELYCFKSLTKPTFRPTLEIAVKAGHAYTLKCDASAGKASVFVSQETRMLKPCALRRLLTAAMR